MVDVQHYLVVSAVLFSWGVVGVMFRRNLIFILMSLELMLNAVNLSFVSITRYLGSVEGQIVVLFVMVVAAAEVAVGLALIVAIFRTKHSIDIDQMNSLKG